MVNIAPRAPAVLQRIQKMVHAGVASGCLSAGVRHLHLQHHLTFNLFLPVQRATETSSS
jgi:hypothetical protein